MSEHEHHFILRYLEGTQTSEEKEEFESWINTSPENQQLVDSYRKIWDTSNEKINTEFDPKTAWNEFSGAVDLEESTQRNTWSVLKLAAVIIALIVASVTIYFLNSTNERLEIHAGKLPLHTSLPDGSEVWLNENTSIFYSDDFADDRSLELVGEAFFDVKEDRSHPFTISANKGVVKVVGTSFNVKANDNDSISVYVVTGRVSLSLNKSIELTSGQRGVATNNSTSIIMTIADPNEIAWKTKQLVFLKDKLEDVTRRLQIYFKKEIRISNDSLATCRFTGTFDDPTLNEIFETLGFALEIRIDSEKNGYVITGNGCNSN